MDTGNYQYSQYETAAQFDSRMNACSSGQAQQSQNVMPQQSGMFSQQSGMQPQQTGVMGQQSGPMSHQPGMSQQSHQTGTMPQQYGMMSQQSGIMSQQSVTMSQQSGTMSQQSGIMSQQSGLSMDMQQSSNMWIPPQSNAMMSGSNNMNFSQQGTNNFGNLDSYSQQSNSFGLTSDSYITGQNQSDSQQYINMNQQPVSGYNQRGSDYQQGRNYGGGMSDFQDNNSVYQQDNFGHGNSYGYQQSNYRNNNPPSFQQGGQNTMNQQRNMGSQYGQESMRSSTKPQTAGYQQGNRASSQPNTRNATDMNDPLNDFYSEIGSFVEETGPNFQHQPLPGSNNSGFGQHSNMGQNRQEVSSQMGSWKPRMDNGNVAKGVQNRLPDGSTPGQTREGSKPDFADEDTEYCKLCNVYFTSAPMYAFHVRGLAHAQRLMAAEAGKDRKAVEKPFIISGKNYTQTVPQEPVKKQDDAGKQTEEGSAETAFSAGCYCEVCDIHVNSERMLWRHYQGKKHLKALKAVEKGELKLKPVSQRPVDPNIQKAVALMEARIPNDEVSSLNFAFDTVPEEEPIVGLGFLVESMENMMQVIECELCKTKGNLNNMVQHVLGQKHRLQYLKVRDRERYFSINKLNKKQVQAEDARVLCLELEKEEGRGTARYSGPPRRIPRDHERRLMGRAITPPPAHLLRYREQQNVMSESEKRLAVESLKRTLLDDFHKRNIDPDTATKILNSRMELLAEYEKRGVPFVVARERVIEEEERWNLLLEFERQVLSFDEAEQRIDHRFELMKMYEKNGYPREEARRKVLDDEVIYDFKRDFVRLGLQREQAQKLAEKRLWMLEHLHYQGLSPEDASEKVVIVERELKRFLRTMFEEDRRGRSRDSERVQWMVAGEELENYIVQSSRELGLSVDQTEDQVSLALEAFDRYRQRRIPADEAKCRVLVDDLPIPRQPVERAPICMEAESASDPGSQADITNRVLQFKSKLNAVMQATADSTKEDKETEKKEPVVVDEEKQLADYDQQSRLEIQNLLSDMLKMKVPADEARKRLVALYKQHESLRENLFPAKKLQNSSAKVSKSGTSEESKKAEDVPALAEDLPSKDNQSSEKKDAAKPSEENQSSKKNSSKPEEKTADDGEKEVKSNGKKTSGEVVESEISADEFKTERLDEKPSGDTSEKSSDMKKLTTANDRWNSSVELFLQQYGLSKEEYRSQMSKRRSSGHERYSPSDLSPRRSRSRSFDRPGRSSGAGRESSPHSSHWRDSDRDEKRRRSRSRSAASRWSRMLKSRLRSRSPSDHRRRSFSPEHRGRQRSMEREWDSRFPRRSPGRRSPKRRSPPPFSRMQRPRFSPGRRSPRSRFSPDRRSPPRRRSPGWRSPFGRRSPGRRSPHSRGHSPDRWRSSPGPSWGRPMDFNRYPSRGRRPGRSRSRDRHYSPGGRGTPDMNNRPRPRWNRYKSPVKEPEFNFADGVWPDVDDPWD
ncbi:uncharacterized protein LOC143293608 [Babylonia areolata]|uniref:uncharacterized protein LOC143293608 n=1 Tax=Babylonia areolata TaxID=304850 RepID=UPI003FD45811